MPFYSTYLFLTTAQENIIREVHEIFLLNIRDLTQQECYFLRYNQHGEEVQGFIVIMTQYLHFTCAEAAVVFDTKVTTLRFS